MLLHKWDICFSSQPSFQNSGIIVKEEVGDYKDIFSPETNGWVHIQTHSGCDMHKT